MHSVGLPVLQRFSDVMKFENGSHGPKTGADPRVCRSRAEKPRMDQTQELQPGLLVP